MENGNVILRIGAMKMGIYIRNINPYNTMIVEILHPAQEVET